jgi:hypothetical protein
VKAAHGDARAALQMAEQAISTDSCSAKRKHVGEGLVVRFLLDRARALGDGKVAIPSPALLGKVGESYVQAIDRFAADQEIPVVRFEKGACKANLTAPLIRSKNQIVIASVPASLRLSSLASLGFRVADGCCRAGVDRNASSVRYRANGRSLDMQSALGFDALTSIVCRSSILTQVPDSV